uniref:LRRCT domain-containing protein n=1 Tax=Panagrellus redivivus TaxID=6233 RepID=A0A7E4VQB1_PANRE
MSLPSGCTLDNVSFSKRKKQLFVSCHGEDLMKVMESFRGQKVIEMNFKDCNPPTTRLTQLPNMTLQTLTIANCGIEEIDANAFLNVSDLFKLDLSKNLITNLPNMESLPELGYLFMEDNKISHIPDGTFKTNTPGGKVLNFRYCELNLRKNHFKVLNDSTFIGLEHLVVLDLGFNQISSISPKALNFGKLYQLNLDHNNLLTLPPTVFKSLTKLYELSLNNNKLSQLPSDLFSSNKGLHRLDLSFNDIEQLPSNIFKGRDRLFYLELNNNKLKSLDENVFSGAEYISTLYLHDNQLEHLPPKLFHNLKRMKKLYLDNNRLTEIPKDFVAHSKLKDVFLSNNRIKALPEKVFAHLDPSEETFPIVISLRNNSLTTVPQSAFKEIPIPDEDAFPRRRFGILLHGNPLICDEKLAWLVERVQTDAIFVDHQYFPKVPTCAGPLKFSGQALEDVELH